MFWGISEARNFYEEYLNGLKVKPAKLDILLFGIGDPCHILKTLSKSYEYNKKDEEVELNFYLVEGCVELLARDLVLINVALENDEYFSINAKTHLYMDLFGNSLLRSATYMYLISKSEQLINLITDSEFAEVYAPIFSFEFLKYKEKDQLETVFEFFKNKSEHVFNIKQYWDDKNRFNLKERYDTRSGAFDWDLHMVLKSRGASQICSQEYSHWRECGVAFTFPEYDNSYPNKTFVVDLRRDGRRFCHRGYVGDMTVGPYVSFGLDCADEKMLSSKFGTNQCRATDISERNLYELFYELKNHEKFDASKDNKNFREYGAVKLQLGNNFDVEKVMAEEKSNLIKYEKPLKSPKNVKIHLMSVEDTLNIQKKPQFQNKFDVIWVANNYFAFLKDDFKDLFAEKCLVMFETKKYSTLKKEQVNDNIEEIKSYCKKCDCLEPITCFNMNAVNSIVKYKKNQN